MLYAALPNQTFCRGTGRTSNGNIGVGQAPTNTLYGYYVAGDNGLEGSLAIIFGVYHMAVITQNLLQFNNHVGTPGVSLLTVNCPENC